ncbi:MAG: hypothetical protein Q8L81_09115 [Bacteroidota bacterium]|nr:hypothetical protein [Bacteroidota bacterium]
MKKKLLFLLLLLTFALNAQRPKDGTYTLTIVFKVWNGKSNTKSISGGSTCTAIVKNDSIKIINNGDPGFWGGKGDILDVGLIVRHKKTGRFIIAHGPLDQDSEEIDNSKGPRILDFSKKVFWL